MTKKNRGIVITLSGPHGTGKSTIAKEIAKKFNLRYISAGALFRKLAEQQGMNLKNFNLFTEQNPDIDLAIDRITKEEAKKGNVVIDGRLSAWMANDADLKILLTAPTEIRIRRIALRDNKDYEQAYKETISREESERKRYLSLYKIDVDDISIYDIVLNTAKYSKESCIKILSVAVEELLTSSTEE